MRFVGVHYAITTDQRDGLLAQADDAKKMEYFGAEIEEKWDEQHGQISDTAWERIHCCLTDSDKPDPNAGKPPLNLAVLGGQQVLKSEKAYIIRLIEAEQVKEVAAALKDFDRSWMDGMFKKHSPGDDKDVVDVTWDWFDKMRAFFERAAKNGRAVLFTADQ